MGEYLKSHAHGDHHSSMLVLVDRWGKPRGQFDWQDAEQLDNLFKLAAELQAEKTPAVSLSSD